MDISTPPHLSASAQPPVVSAPLSLLHIALRHWVAILLAGAISVFYLGTIGALPLLGKDEPRYVEVAREMLQRGDWVTPTLGERTWFEKPALLYWMIIVSFKAFGISEWAARIGPALCALATVGLVLLIARRVEHLKAGPVKVEPVKTASLQAVPLQQETGNMRGLALWSALAMASSLGLVSFAHGATFDIILTATITFALACFFVAELESEKRKRQGLLAGLWVGVGLSLMAKGLVGLLLPGGIILVYFALRRDWRGLTRLQMSWGLPLALAVAATWYGPVIARHGEVFINEFFVQHHFERYLSNKYGHPQPVYYYLPIIALFSLPWTAFVFGTLREMKASTWQDDDAGNKLRVFAVAWLVVPIAFFSLSGSKLPGYILPSLPGAILLAGIAITAYVHGKNGNRYDDKRDEGNSYDGNGYARATGVVLFVLGAVMAILTRRPHVIAWPGILAVTLPLLAAGITVTVTASFARFRALNAGLIVGSILLSVGLLTGSIGVPLTRSMGVRTLLRTADEQGYGRDAVWQLQTTQRTAEFYATGRILYDDKGEPKEFQKATEIAQSLPRGGAALVLVPRLKADQLLQSPLLHSRFIGDNGDIALIRVRLANPVVGGAG